ncbi:hypothetical protein NHL50_04915 [Acidimicrobiia bacterium EGI L10123]|uniref:hypothetical protein n=1 Tax=Salinilacustrithrix flava TaxID=2957203 RepID=UPI003D7C3050|nr:hypothetical protein [Acidimicrobiia bacterium EGI L10123]
MNDDEMYVHRPGIVVAREHVWRYPRHYAALGLFLVAMLLVPTVGPRDLADLASSSSPAGATAPEDVLPLTPPSTASAAPAAPPSTAARAVADAFGIDTDTAAAVIDGAGGSTPPPPPSSGGEEPAPAPAPDDAEDAGPAGVPLPSPPAVPVPPVPDEVQPLLAAVGPLTDQGCSGLGLAAVVVAVVGTAAQDVPVGQVLPYLAPVYSACATFPPPAGEATVCELDRAAHDAGYPTDVSGLMKTPNAIGTGVDVLYGIEAAIEAYTGQSPELVAGIADQLGCSA